MSNYSFTRIFRIASQLTLTLLLAASLALFCEIATLTPADAVRTYHSFPYMAEHILVGVVLYLAFSAAAAKIHRSGVHDGR